MCTSHHACVIFSRSRAQTMPEAVRVEVYKQNAERLPVKHIGTPEEVAEGKMCLCISAHALTGGDSLPVCDEVLVHHRADRARRRRGNVHVGRLIHEVNNTRHVYLQAILSLGCHRCGVQIQIISQQWMQMLFFTRLLLQLVADLTAHLAGMAAQSMPTYSSSERAKRVCE
jgi:hypothetical protein